MKKLSLYTISVLLGASMIACDDYKEPNPPAQSNKPIPVLQASDVTETPVITGQTYDLQDLYNNGQIVGIATVSCKELAEGYTFGGYGYISVDDFENYAEVPMYSEKSADANVWTLYVQPKDLNDVYRNNISIRDNDPVTLQFHFQLTTIYSIEQGDQVALVGGADNYYGPYDITILPFEFTVASFQYLYTPGDANGWSFDKCQRLFTDLDNNDEAYVIYKGLAKFENQYKYVSTDNWDYGLNFGAGEEEGTLSTDSAAGNILVDETGLYYSVVNVNELTYTNDYIETVGIVGSATEGQWDVSTPLTTEDYLIWEGEVHLVPGEYKFRCNNAWDVNLGGTSENLEFNGANLVFDGEEGTYVVTLDLTTLPYTCTVKVPGEDEPASQVE